MKRSAFIVLVIILGFQACTNAPKKEGENSYTSQTSRDSAKIIKNGDDAFLANASRQSLAEMELGRLARANSSNERVKKFGSMMEANHKTMHEQLKALALSKSILLPETTDEARKKEFNRLSDRKGSAFDLPYMKLMVKNHRSDVKRFRSAVNDATDPDVRSFARELLPTLQKHLDSAKVIYNSLKPPLDNVIVP